MIELTEATLRSQGRAARTILSQVTISFPPRARIGILASPGSGKTTLARHLSGIDQPDAGTVTAKGAVSWPLGTASFLHPHLTIQQNLRFVAHLRGVEEDDYVTWCLAFSDLQSAAKRPVSQLTGSQRALLAYASCIHLPWDWLIADEVITVGEPIARMKCDAMLEEHKGQAGLIFISRNPASLRKYCDQHFVMLGEKLKPCDDLDVAKKALAIERGTSEEELEYV